MRKNKKKLPAFSHIPLALKLGGCFLFLTVSMFVLLNTYGIHAMKAELFQTKEAMLYDSCSQIAEAMPETFPSQNIENFFGQLTLAASLADCRLLAVSSDGNILFDSGSSKRDYYNISDYEPDFLTETAIDSTDIGGLISYQACAVIYPGYLIGLIPVRRISQESIAYTDVFNLCFLLYCLFLFLIFLVIYAITVLPLKKTIQAVQSYSSGNYDFKLHLPTRDEYEELADSAAFLAGELKNLEDYQKKFIANISHDLRSPLTSIKGYAEAMADGTIPPELYGKYLHIIVYETTRLVKLSQSLLALNSYENHGAMLEMSVFDINSSIRQMALSFEGTGKQKGIQIHLVFEEPSLLVSADMEKIEQVLYNLLDNAIKFSYENKNIQISTKAKGTKAIISVKDYGIGIPKESLQKVFDRFYKTDRSRGKDKKGSGLGLSITKDILTAHKEHISVVSTPGAGTEFTFSLPIAPRNKEN